ncbi:MAG: isopenicillin N-epimerase [Cyanobacteria bacterium RYN_339]|nr:isopenicillin N-epimerase [Cyanobacteria bacterium RYN_339]
MEAMTSPLPLPAYWSFTPGVTFLNHGSFGACPVTVRAAQDRIRDRLEQEPCAFLVRELEPLLDAARARLGAFVGADPDDLAFIPNTTTGIGTVLASLTFAAGDEVLTTSHVYSAVRNALNRQLEGSGARLVEAPVPFPLEDPAQVVEAVLAAVTPRTRLAVLDHITSTTALIFPIQALVLALRERGVETLVDGAHAPGQVPLDLAAIDPAYYAGNCHKWLCAPKGSAFLYVRRDLQPNVRPLITSHGASSPRRDRSRFRLEFDWVGTTDPSAYLAVPSALELPIGWGGWDGWMAANHALAVEARMLITQALGVSPACPDAMLGAMATIPLPRAAGEGPQPPYFIEPLQDRLFTRHGIETMVFPWPAWPDRVLRISAQRYNTLADYQKLAEALLQEL